MPAAGGSETVSPRAVKLFHLNALSSPILIKKHFDLVMTMIADSLYYRLAQNLRHFEEYNAPKRYAVILWKDRVKFNAHNLCFSSLNKSNSNRGRCYS